MRNIMGRFELKYSVYFERIIDMGKHGVFGDETLFSKILLLL